MSELSPNAQPFIDRVNYLADNPPAFSEREALEALEHQYDLLGREMPEPQVVADLTDAWKLQDLYHWDRERDMRMQSLMADSVMDADRASEAMDVIAKLPSLKRLDDQVEAAGRRARPDQRYYCSALGSAAMIAIPHHQRGITAMTPDARRYSLVVYQDLIAAENGLGWYWPTEEKLVLVPRNSTNTDKEVNR